MRLRDIDIRQVNRLRLRPENYKQSKPQMLREEPLKKDPKFLNVPPEKESRSFSEALLELFALELVAINGVRITQDEVYCFDERAGIYEYEGRLSRAEAERRAFNEILENRKTIQLKNEQRDY
jgi:hypothetical protein